MRPAFWLVSIVFTMCLSSAVAQDQRPLREQLKGKSSFSEIMSTVNAYYKGKPTNWRGPKGLDPRYVHWKRWEWYWSSRLGPEGEFVDVNARVEKAYASVHEIDQRSMNAKWTLTGPDSTNGTGIGRADRIAFHPTDSNTIYVGSPEGGLWRTTNGGTSWQPLTDFLPSIGITGIVVSWANPNIIYILTGDGDSDLGSGFVDVFDYKRLSRGVYKSLDGGLTWNKTGQVSISPFIAIKLVQDPVDPDILLLVSDKGIYRTIDGGDHWSYMIAGQYFDIEYKPGTTEVYAAGRNISGDNAYPIVKYSTDSGQNWMTGTVDDPGLDRVQRMELAISPANPTYIFLLIGDADTISGNFGGLFSSTNGGMSYSMMIDTPNILGRQDTDNFQQALYTHTFCIHPQSSAIMFAGAVHTSKSQTTGALWTRSFGMHDDIHQLAFNPLNNKLYACTDGGVYVTADLGNTWTNLWTGFATSQFYHMSGTSLDPNYLIGGLQDNGVKRRISNAKYFENIPALDGFSTVFSPLDKDLLVFSSNMDVILDNHGIQTTITPITEDTLKEWFGHIVTHINTDSTIFVGYSDVYKSIDRGNTWTNLGVDGSWAMTSCPSFSSRLYVAGGGWYGPTSSGGMWRTNNLGATWDTLHTKPGFPSLTSKRRITDIAVCPVNSNIVVVTIGGFIDSVKVYRSDDAGFSWTSWTGTLPNIPVNCAAVTTSGDVYIGTDIGVFYRKATMADWIPYRNNLPVVPVTDLVLQETEGKLYCSTFGRGVWSANVADDTCPGIVVLAGHQTGYNIYRANVNITATCKVVGTVGTDIHLRANNNVIMKPGFAAFRNSRFSAAIAPCLTPGSPLTEDPIVESK